MIIGLNVVYFLNRKKDKKIFKIITIILFVVFFCSYIQGNYLVSNLPLLDGSIIIWSDYKVDWIISIVLWIFVIGLVIILIKKLTLNKMIKYTGFVGLAIFLMLTISLSTSILTSKERIEKDFIPMVTYKDINKYSLNKNIVVLLLDCVDSKLFVERMNGDADFKDMLKDFTYYPDTMSGHPMTDESIPLILTGKYYKNDGPLVEWSTNAYKESYLFDLMEKNGYELDIYEQDILYNDKSATRISNIYDYNQSKSLISKIKFWKQELKYILFRYLPSYLKRFSKIDEMHFSALYLDNKSANSDKRFFDLRNVSTLEVMKNSKLEKTNKNIFKFIHVQGAHTPWRDGKDFKSVINGTYENGLDSALTFTKGYLEFLKQNNLYDSMTIVIMADHGFKLEESQGGRQNPILFIKSINDKQDKMIVSDKPVSFVDFNDLYKDLVDGKKTKEIFASIPNSRTRYYISYYNSKKKDIMTEYATKGKAWETDKLYKTGNEYKKNW
jgi:hypothetical protein